MINWKEMIQKVKNIKCVIRKGEGRWKGEKGVGSKRKREKARQC